MKTFESIEANSYSFSDCNNCDARCCDGARGSTYAQITLEDFEHIGQHFPILFTKGEHGYLMPVVLLSNGQEFCKYLKDFKCSIYENRPSICKVYPLSPYVTNEIYIDTSCPAVIKDENSPNSKTYTYEAPVKYNRKFQQTITTENHTVMIEKGTVKQSFDNEKFHDYQNKVLQTFHHFKTYNYESNLQLFTEIRNMQFYIFKPEVNDSYVQLHLQTLKHFDEYYKT